MLDRLPIELVEKVLGYVPRTQFDNVRLLTVNRAFYEVISAELYRTIIAVICIPIKTPRSVISEGVQGAGFTAPTILSTTGAALGFLKFIGSCTEGASRKFKYVEMNFVNVELDYDLNSRLRTVFRHHQGIDSLEEVSYTLGKRVDRHIVLPQLCVSNIRKKAFLSVLRLEPPLNLRAYHLARRCKCAQDDEPQWGTDREVEQINALIPILPQQAYREFASCIEVFFSEIFSVERKKKIFGKLYVLNPQQDLFYTTVVKQYLV